MTVNLCVLLSSACSVTEPVESDISTWLLQNLFQRDVESWRMEPRGWQHSEECACGDELSNSIWYRVRHQSRCCYCCYAAVLLVFYKRRRSISREALLEYMLGFTLTQVTRVTGSESRTGNLRITPRLWTLGRTNWYAWKTGRSSFDLHGLPPTCFLSNQSRNREKRTSFKLSNDV